MDPHNEWSMSKELAAQACDQCYRCKLRCSRTQPACHRCQGNGSACTWSMGKWLGKPKGTKRKLSGEKEHAEWTHGQQECRSPEKETAASACRSESRDDLYISEAVWPDPSPDIEGRPRTGGNKTGTYVTTLECPSDCLQMSGENLSNEEDNFLLWPLSPGIPAEKPSTSTIEKQPLQPTARLIAYSPKPFQYSKNPPKRDFATFPDQSISERAIRGHEKRTLPTKSPDSSAVGWFGPSPKRHNFSYQSRVGRSIDLLSPPESSYSWERQDQPQQHEMRSENYQSHANKQSAPSYQPTESMRSFSSPLPLLDTENSTRQQARTFSFEDSQAVQIQMNRSRPGHHRRTHTETEISSLDNQHRGLEPPNSRFPQSLQTRCNCLPQLLESLSKTDTLLLARDLLSACEASMRCKSCSNSDLALLQRLIGLQKVYSCLYLLREGEKRYPLTRSSKSGFQYRHNHKQEDQASAMRSTKRFTGLASFDEERNEGGRDMELEGGRNPPGEEEDEKHLAENCKSDVAEAVRMLVIRAVTMVSQEEMLSISRGPRAGDMPSVEENSTLTFGSQISILLKNFRALLGLES